MSSPTPSNVPQIRLYQDWLREQRGLRFDSYRALWQWSVTDLDAFWQSIWDYFELHSPTPHTAVLGKNVMPGAQWFPGARVNYAQQVFRHVDAAHAAGLPAIVSDDEKGHARELSWPELKRQVASLALHLQEHGVQPGDRVAAYLPNVPETIVAFLAVASIGAVWSVCAPDMGTNAVLDRLRQIEPKVLIAVDGVTWAGMDIDRTPVLAELRAELPSLRHLLLVNNLDAAKTIADSARYTDVVARNDAEVAAFEPLWLPFDHPLWIVYSSGTTGLPKPIVHSHGGIVLVAMVTGLHMDQSKSKCQSCAHAAGARCGEAHDLAVFDHRLVMDDQRRAIGGQQHQPPHDAILFLPKQRIAAAERFRPLDGKAQARLQRRDLGAQIVAPMTEALFHAAAVERVVPHGPGARRNESVEYYSRLRIGGRHFPAELADIGDACREARHAGNRHLACRAEGKILPVIA